MEHLFKEYERLGAEYNCSRNGTNINFYLLDLSVFAASVEVIFGLGSVSLTWTGLMLAGICLGCAPHCVQQCFTCSLCKSGWEGAQRGPGHPIYRLISARHRLVAVRDGVNPPYSEGLRPCGSRRNSTWCWGDWGVAVLELWQCHPCQGWQLGQGTDPTVTPAQLLPAARHAACRRTRVKDVASREKRKMCSFQTLGLPLLTDVMTFPNGNLCQIAF